MKKAMSRLLVFVLIVNLLTPFAKTETVLAAVTGLDVEMNRSLSVGTQFNTPVDSTDVQEDEVFVSWDFTEPIEDYDLTFPIRDNSRILFKVDKLLGVATVRYYEQFWDSETNDWNTKDIDTSGSSYMIHSSLDAGGIKNFIPFETFLLQLNGNDPDYKVEKNEEENVPTFRIRENTGFSFIYFGREIHFLWDAKKGAFEISSNMMTSGFIYPYELSVYDIASGGRDSGASPSSIFTKQVITGINKKTLQFTPYANSGNTAKRKYIPSENDPEYHSYVLDLTPESTVEAEPPGSDEVEMKMRFDVPKRWDESTKTFYNNPSNPLPQLPLVINFGNVDPKEAIQAKISDITIQNPSLTLTRGSVKGVEGIMDPSDGSIKSIEFTIGDLSPGMLYHLVYFEFETNQVVHRNTELPFGSAFTFLKYDIVSDDGKFYARIHPYKGIAGYYMLSAGTNLRPSVEMQHDGRDTVLQLPLDIDAENLQSRYYQIFFSPEKQFEFDNVNDSVYSQIVKYQALPEAVEIDTPAFFNIVNYMLLPEDYDFSGDKGILKMNVTWDLGKKSILDSLMALNGGKMNLKYELAQSLTPNNTNPTPFTTVNLAITSGSAIEVEYTGENVTTKGKVELKTSFDSYAGTERYYAQVDLEFNAANKHASEIENADKIPFFYENIYFLSIRPVERDGININKGWSLYADLTLDNISRLKVPPPQNLDITDVVTTSVQLGDPKDEVSFKMNVYLPGNEIQQYLNNSFNLPAELAEIKMNIYISQNEQYMREAFFKLTPEERFLQSSSVNYDLARYGYELYFSSIGGVSDSKVLKPQNSSYRDAREALRDNKVVRVASISLTEEQNKGLVTSGPGLTLSYKVDGVDKNQKYYSYVDLEVIHNDLENGKLVTRVNTYSMLSNLVSVTTKADKEVPTGVDKVPIAPIIDKKDVGLGQATLFWNKIPPISDGEVVEYELVRLKGSQMDQGYLDNRDKFSVFWDEYFPKGVEKVGIRTDGKELKIQNEKPEHFTYDPSDKTIFLTDKSLTPNNLYFYYIRTVRIIDGEEFYSTWNGVSVTTTLIDNPINLKIESNRTDYDPMREIMISFDAPVPDLSLIGSKYNIQYQLKESGGDWQTPITMNAAQLIELATDAKDKGYFHFLYKVKGLKAGTTYFIRVKMVEISGESSMYSNEETFKTDIDQDEYDKETEVDNWLEYFKKLIEQLLKNPYWVGKSTSSELEVIYRPTRFDTLMAESTDSTISLIAGEGSKHTYYIPASAMISANANNKGFKLSKDDVDIIISPKSINTESNSVVFDISDKIKKKDLADYYVKINFDWYNSNAYIQGEQPLTKDTNVTFELVGSKITSVKWDESIREDVEKEVKDILEDKGLLSDIKRALEKGYTNEEMVQFIEKLVEDATKDIQKTISRDFNYDLRKSSYYSINTLDSPLIFATRGLDVSTSVKGYVYQYGTWATRDVVDFGDNKAMYVNEPGRYVLTGYTLRLNGIDAVTNSTGVTGIIAKYGLDDFFGRENVFNIEANATRNMVAGSVARMLGAPKGVNAVEWLNQNYNLSISTRNTDGNITTQEAIYIVMSLYESRTNTKVDTIRISNFGRTANISLDDKYKQSVRAAFEVGIYNNDRMQPNAPVTIKELLDILGILDSKSKL